MRAAVITKAGGVPALQEVDEPRPTEHGTVVTVTAAGVNPHDLVVAAGVNQPPPVPYVPGSEGVGTVGDGTRVYFGRTHLPHGSFAERAVTSADSVQEIPDALADGAALAIGVAGISARLSLTRKAGLRQGEQVLVLGATGSVGRIAIQAAKVLGAGRVVAGRNPAVLDALKERGADEVVRLDDDCPAALRKASQGGFDLVGGHALRSADGRSDESEQSPWLNHTARLVRR
ncbi:zinc-binding alcohol dehydrogenase family protein [Streptomyces sp. NBC_00076]|uniref:quinone oxidoreductase family protein n=1 Tax=Streptomyces sp. NBC_00076 TaxID=2975642 RepID=UPI00324C1DD2